MRRVFSLALSIAAACVQDRKVEIDAEPGDLVVLAAVSASGAIVEQTRWAPELLGGPLSIGTGESLVAFILPHGELVGPDGRPLPDDMLSAVQVSASPTRSAGSVQGTCGRCLAASDIAPQVVNAGDRCALPVFAKIEIVAGVSSPSFDLEQLRAGLFLEWPGACACEPYALEQGNELTAELIELTPQLHPIEDVGQAANGDVAIASRTHLEVVAADGTSRAEKSAAELPFTGPILAAASTADGEIYVASHDESSGDAKSVLHVFSPELSVTGSKPLSVRPLVGKSSGGVIYLAGQTHNRDDPQAVACVPKDSNLGTCGPAAALTCNTFSPTQAGITGNAFYDVAQVGSAFVVSGTKALLFYERPIDPTLTISVDSAASGTTGTISDCRGPVRWRILPAAFFGIDDQVEIRRVGNAGEHLLACIGGTPARIAAFKPGADFFEGLSTPALREFPFFGPGDCGGFSAVPECPGAVRASMGGASIVLAEDGSGELVERSDCTASAQAPSANVYSLVPDFTLARSYGGRLYVRDDRAPAPEFSLVYGGERVEAPVATIVTLDDRFIAIRQNGELELVSTADGSVASSKLKGLSGNETVLLATVLDAAARELLVVTHRDGAHFYRLKNAGTLEQLEEYPLRGNPDLSQLIFRDISPIAPQIFGLITTDGRIFILRHDELTEVERRSSEPIPPRGIECPQGPYPSVDGSADILRGISGSLGVAWAAGCEGTLYRVAPYSAPSLAVDITLKGRGLYDEIQDGPPSLFSVSAACPDSVLFAGPGTGRVDQEQGRLFELAPTVGLRLEPINLEARAGSLLGSGRPFGLAATRTFAALAFDQGAVRIAGEPNTYRIEDPVFEVAVHPSGAVLAGTATGRLIFGTVSR
jgi:hypothetical protein